MLGFLREEGQLFLDKLNRWSVEKEETLKDEDGRRYGVGVYFYEDTAAEGASTSNEHVDLVGNA
jgi:hypothetical protein